MTERSYYICLLYEESWIAFRCIKSLPSISQTDFLCNCFSHFTSCCRIYPPFHSSHINPKLYLIPVLSFLWQLSLKSSWGCVKSWFEICILRRHIRRRSDMSCHVLSFRMFLRQTPEHTQEDEGTILAHTFLGALSPNIIYFHFGIKQGNLFISLCVGSSLCDWKEASKPFYTRRDLHVVLLFSACYTFFVLLQACPDDDITVIWTLAALSLWLYEIAFLPFAKKEKPFELELLSKWQWFSFPQPGSVGLRVMKMRMVTLRWLHARPECSAA